MSTLCKSMNIARLSEELDPNTVLKRVRDIFFLTSRQGADLAGCQKEDFFYNWAGWYMETAPEQTGATGSGQQTPRELPRAKAQEPCGYKMAEE